MVEERKAKEASVRNVVVVVMEKGNQEKGRQEAGRHGREEAKGKEIDYEKL